LIIKTNNTVQASWIAIGGLFSFGFGIVSSMILSRYFLKDDYGTYKQVLYVYNTLLVVFTLGLPKAYSYFLPRVDQNQAKSLIKKLTNLFFLLGGLFSVFLFVASDYIALILKSPDLSYPLKVFSPVPFLMLPTMGLEGVLATFRKTKFMALYTVVTRVVMLLCVVLPVLFFDGGYIQAIIGFTSASFLSFLLALYLKYYPVKNKGNDPVEKSYKEILTFSLPLLTASVWGILISSADQFFISRYFGNEVFAEYSNGALKLPFVAIILGATSTVLSPVFSRMSYEKLDPQTEVLPLWKSVFEKSAMLIYPLLIYTWVFADVVMVLLYGRQYEISSVYFRIFNTINFFDIIIFAPLLINTGKVRYYANVHLFIAVMVISLEYLSVLIFNSPFAISAVSLFCQLVKIYLMLLVVAKIFSLKIIQLFPLKLIYKILLPSILILALEYYIFTKILDLNPFATLTFSFLIYISIFYAYSLRAGLDYKNIVTPLFSRFKNK